MQASGFDKSHFHNVLNERGNSCPDTEGNTPSKKLQYYSAVEFLTFSAVGESYREAPQPGCLKAQSP